VHHIVAGHPMHATAFPVSARTWALGARADRRRFRSSSLPRPSAASPHVAKTLSQLPGRVQQQRGSRQTRNSKRTVPNALADQTASALPSSYQDGASPAIWLIGLRPAPETHSPIRGPA